MQVHSYERFTPLSIEGEGLVRGYLDVQPGDCVVAFSRRDIYDIKQLIEASTGQRCMHIRPLSMPLPASIFWLTSVHVTLRLAMSGPRTYQSCRVYHHLPLVQAQPALMDARSLYVRSGGARRVV